MDIPGDEEIVKESYAQLRKFNCWNIAIVQQYARFKESRIRAAVFGNSRQFFLMRQNDRADLDDIGADISLSDVTKQTILSYPLPDQEPADKFAAFTYLHTDAVRPVCGTVHNVASPEMLYCSSTTGSHFERRARELRDSTNVVQGIVDAAKKTFDNATLVIYCVCYIRQLLAEGEEPFCKKSKNTFAPSHQRSRPHLPSSPMTSLRTYPIHSQATAWLRCAGMFLRIGKPGFGFGVQATNTRPSSANEDLTKEASR
jgi:hypothetical protein